MSPLAAAIDRVLWTEAEIAARVEEMAGEIAADLAPLLQPPPPHAPSTPREATGFVVVGVATGAALFLADLVRKLPLPVAIDLVRVESYGEATEALGEPRITAGLKVDVKGKRVLVVEDIVDTGNTVASLLAYLQSLGAASISVCAFLDKPSRRKVPVRPIGDDAKFYRGFECPDDFVVGYGMDYAELYRNLPYIGVLKPEMYKRDVRPSR